MVGGEKGEAEDDARPERRMSEEVGERVPARIELTDLDERSTTVDETRCCDD